MRKKFEGSGFRQSMSGLHTWSGLILGSLLYFIFITGSLGYFDNEITHWMQPGAPVVKKNTSQQEMLRRAESYLGSVAPNASMWWVNFPSGRQYSLRVWWFESSTDSGEGKWKSTVLDPLTGMPSFLRETNGGDALYSMHYALYYMPEHLAYWLVSLASMFMLVAIITGIVIHKKIFKDFFTFRHGKKQRSWLDVHNVLSVLPLPFHLIITYSGLVFLMFTTMPAVISASYGVGEENRGAFLDQVFTRSKHFQASDSVTAAIPLVSVLPDVEARWGIDQILYIGMEERGSQRAKIKVGQLGYNGVGDGSELVYHGVNGELIHESNSESETTFPGVKIYDVLTHIHEGQFANFPLRWLYFISGLMGAGMIASGTILWTMKRIDKAYREGQPKKRHTVFDVLNVSTIVGLPIGIVVYFWANRLIPLGVENRAALEINSLFIAWAFTLIAPLMFFHRFSIRQLWEWELTVAAFLYMLLPVLNMFISDKHLGNTLPQGDWVIAGFDLMLIGVGLACCFAALSLRHGAIRKRLASMKIGVASDGGEAQ